MPCLYLIDSIVKNHPNYYRPLFEQNIISTFAHVFGHVLDTTGRMSLNKLRNTWNVVFAAKTLHALDVRVQRELDPKWPVQSVAAIAAAAKAAQQAQQAQQASASASSGTIHINPAVFGKQQKQATDENDRLARELAARKAELMKLQKEKLEMEIAMTNKQIEVSHKQQARKVFIRPKRFSFKGRLPIEEHHEGIIIVVLVSRRRQLNHGCEKRKGVHPQPGQPHVFHY